jgi:hypothetical protein
MSLFTGLSEEICQRAWVGVESYIATMATAGEFNKFAGTIIVVDPRVIDRPKGEHADEVFDSAIIFTAFVDGVEDPNYTKVARSKALVSWRTGLPSSEVQRREPFAFAEGDTFWGGSTVTPSGMIVTFSGVQACHDEAISEVMASTIRSISINEVTKRDGVLDTWERTRHSFLTATPVMRD